jgi:EAL domain-containing protein (putative c-di-GMP-specific phosphodiesterase class I)
MQAIVTLGKNLDMELIAEGIENVTQLACCRR